jgi:hypothetical protein
MEEREELDAALGEDIAPYHRGCSLSALGPSGAFWRALCAATALRLNGLANVSQ